MMIRATFAAVRHVATVHLEVPDEVVVFVSKTQPSSRLRGNYGHPTFLIRQ